jgi:hypothetical protein
MFLILGIACLALAAMFLLRPGRPNPLHGTGPGDASSDSTVADTNMAGDTPPPDKPPVAKSDAPRRAAAGPANTARPLEAASPPSSLWPQPTPETRQLVNNLFQLPVNDGSLNADLAATWRTNLAQLTAHGAAAIPAIVEFLDKNSDLEFGPAGKQALGYGSARLALLDVLAQVGGTDGLRAMTGVLGVTADPREIATLGRYLEQLDPGAHRQEVLDAARQALAMAREGGLSDRDVAPLFEVFQNYGDASIASDLMQDSKQWNYYSMLALAQLPEGAGIPGLIQIVNGEGGLGTGARVPALEMLAQSAGGSDVARAALLDQVKQNKLTAYNWATLESILAGDQVRFQDSAFDSDLAATRSTDTRRTHISSGNQNFYSAPPVGGLTPEQIQQQNALIDELMKATTDQTGLAVLQRAKALLEKRAGGP